MANEKNANGQEVSKNLNKENYEDVEMHWHVFRFVVILGSLYFFLFGLDVMGNAFKALSGKAVGGFFSGIQNPIAGVMVGILATVLLQSSSTTTSIVVSMVGADIVSVRTAIPMIMGANIGTSVTNTIVSHGHVTDKEEFQRAFAGATVHDIFNLLSVTCLLPIEIITGALGFPLLENLTGAITEGLTGIKGASTFKSPLKVIVSPLTKVFISVNKDIIKALSQGCQKCAGTFNTSGILSNYTGCYDVKGKSCYDTTEWTLKYTNGKIIKSGALAFDDNAGGWIALFLSLFVLCVALYLLVSYLSKAMMSNGGDNTVLKYTKMALEFNPYVSILFGTALTIMVQSSSVTTSTFTPLVGLGVITVEQMLPLTLGANIGTTFTAILASLVSTKTSAIQIALCHFFFNIFGIMIWFPIPQMREIPVSGAAKLGEYVVKFPWFGIFYILYTFITVPALLWGVSGIFSLGVAGIIFGIIFVLALGAGSVAFIYYFVEIAEYITQNEHIKKLTSGKNVEQSLEMGDKTNSV